MCYATFQLNIVWTIKQNEKKNTLKLENWNKNATAMANADGIIENKEFSVIP